ncbi:glucosamine-6-phosphate deaminase [Ferruginibacter sp.]|uniref:glucosamine-6-phosphate deaminase n=1 Tax=Ferruginibacter sp. TaxID=1940288 RepID=UPI00199D376E|nr:glucosamine-6-phosphate deaminase [Ferruginibacter sp.]MBC7625910.1 glucosamine-6-phosphate deaminase [Ferruginibacter sp.]
MKHKIDFTDSLEKIAVKIFPSSTLGSIYVAQVIANMIHEKEAAGKKCIIGLATGSSPKTLYAELVRMHKHEGLSFKNVITFNLDQYYPMEADALQSYHYFMRKNLFEQTDIDPNNYFLPDGMVPKDKVKEHCAAYEKKIANAGGLDLQILGIGVNGHIGFNEPGSGIYTKTRLITLDNSTRIANAYEFGNMSEVPRMAITMGISTILKSKKIILMAWGQTKAPVIQKAVEEDDTEDIPASLLQNHDDCTFVIDEGCASELARIKKPWLTGECIWTDNMIKRAVVNLSLQLKKPVLSLTNIDYNDNGLSDLLVEKGDAYETNLQVFYLLRDSITGWPGGKQTEQRIHHPERSEPFPKKVIIFSPHPDDDIISMGGTFMRLHNQGHEVHVAYQTSGNIAVTDEFVTRFIDFAVGFESMFDIDETKSKTVLENAIAFLKTKKSTEKDTAEIRDIKGLIRRCEAKATCKYVGLTDNQIHFQNLPFYETGTIEKNPMGEEDVIITMNFLNKIKPQQIYCAGDFADPHGTHKVCFDVVIEALKRIRATNEPWLADCWLWLYKGAWQEWDITEIEMAIPMSPDQVVKKRNGIFIHQSQKDTIPFQGTDDREFWERAEERNSNTALLYAQLGLTQYAAMEAFVRWHY